ncbi:MAG TPA: DoxX family protein [Geobacteraceae bacterium]
MNIAGNHLYHEVLHMLHIEKGTEEHTEPTIAAPVVLLGRIFFALIFLMAAPNHFTKQAIEYATSQGVPLASVAVPLAGIIAIAGGLSVLVGYHARLGGWLLVLFLLPVTVMMHAFWKVTDPAMAQIQMIMFMKNISMLGGALLITQFGAGPLSFDAKRSHDH